VVFTTAVDVPQADGTVYERFGSLSQVTDPLLETRMNLYWKVVPAGRVTVTYQRLLLEVYLLALRATALLVSQLPSWEMDPTT
jgi:hypothetical protein